MVNWKYASNKISIYSLAQHKSRIYTFLYTKRNKIINITVNIEQWPDTRKSNKKNVTIFSAILFASIAQSSAISEKIEIFSLLSYQVIDCKWVSQTNRGFEVAKLTNPNHRKFHHPQHIGCRNATLNR